MRLRPFLATALTLCLVAAGRPAAAALTVLQEARLRLEAFGLVTGAPAPEDPITRGELARLVVRASGTGAGDRVPAGPAPFRDLSGHPDAAAVAAAHAAGLMTGFPDGTFQPGGLVTYGQAVTVLARLVGLAPVAGEPWPASYIRAAAAAGAIPAGLPVPEYAGLFATRGAVLALLDGALYAVRDRDGRNTYQRVFDPEPPRILISPVLLPRGNSVPVVGKALDAIWVTVAGQPVTPDPDGSFSVPVPLRPGPNRIVVEAGDLAGNRATAEVTVPRPGP